jgi:hypothetical protein
MEKDAVGKAKTKGTQPGAGGVGIGPRNGWELRSTNGSGARQTPDASDYHLTYGLMQRARTPTRGT